MGTFPLHLIFLLFQRLHFPPEEEVKQGENDGIMIADSLIDKFWLCSYYWYPCTVSKLLSHYILHVNERHWICMFSKASA